MDPTFVQRAIHRVADRLIEEAMREGKFDNLPGKGKPIDSVAQPFDETKWVRDWARRQGYTNARFNTELKDIRSGSSETS